MFRKDLCAILFVYHHPNKLISFKAAIIFLEQFYKTLHFHLPLISAPRNVYCSLLKTIFCQPNVIGSCVAPGPFMYFLWVSWKGKKESEPNKKAFLHMT